MAKGRGHNKTGRSEGMGRFAALPHVVMSSPAYIALKPIPRAVLMLVIAAFNGRNNGSIRFSAREGERWGLNKNTTSAGLNALEQAGFLAVTRGGDFNSKRLAREYRITWMASETGSPATREYLSKNASPETGTARPAFGTEMRAELKRCA